jgi:hypothetical protein
MLAYLQHPLWQTRLLGQLLEVFGVWVVINGEVGLHGAKLMVLERGAHAFRTLLAV